MQNKFLYQILCVSLISCVASSVMAEEGNDFLVPTTSTPEQVEPVPTPDPAPKAESARKKEKNSKSDTSVTPDLTGRQAVDFQARTSLDTLELTPLPGIYETNITGPAPLANSVSVKDMPSERLLGLLTPEVFKEMAELERDNTFLKLQIQKETMKNDLERIRANYRQARLDEIAKREDVVRTRIQWWQEQEKIRQDMEAQRAAAESAKNEQEEASALDAVAQNLDDTEEEIPEVIEKLTTETPQKAAYTLINIAGTRNALSARIKNIDSGRISSVQVGDDLADGSRVDEISSTQVVLTKDGQRTIITFEDM